MEVLFTLIVTGPLTLGMSIYALATVRGARPGLDVVMSGFSRFGKPLGLYILMSVFITLWTLLFIIPGIIAVFAYMQAFFILADNPDAGAWNTLRLSRRMMAGNKMKLFFVLLSLIGWGILSVLAESVLRHAALAVFADGSGAAYVITTAVLRCLVFGLLGIYTITIMAVFYEFAAGHRRQRM